MAACLDFRIRASEGLGRWPRVDEHMAACLDFRIRASEGLGRWGSRHRETTVHQEESPCEAEGTPEEETTMAAPPWSQSEDSTSSSQDEERPSTGQDPADAESSHPDPLHLKVAELSEDNGLRSQGEEGPSTGQDPADAESRLHDALHLMMVDLMGFLLHKYRTKQPTSKEEMLNAVLRDDQDHFPAVLSQASECLQLVFGVDVKEVDPREHLYVLVPTLGLTYDGMQDDGQSIPKTGLLLILLGVIVLEGDFAPEEAVWGALSKMGLCAGREHFIYGEPRELITNVWVREGYVEYRQVANSDPARHEFLWGPRAYTETSKLQVLEHFLRINRRGPSSFPSLSEERVSDEEEGA
ncbi:melanoma-associated antigen 11-like protein [Camelus ferus]|nr:melanoma-associated antigen 11-like protein [Camelus ferus]